jgi:hypothetical protein
MLGDLTVTCHAKTRMRQRGLKDEDLRLLLSSASAIDRDAYLLTDRDAAREIARRKREIQSLERLRGVKVVMVGDTIVTCYHTDREAQKAALRCARPLE